MALEKGDIVVIEKRLPGDPPEGASGVIAYVGLGYLRVDFTTGTTRLMEEYQVKKIGRIETDGCKQD